ncbi:MAG: YceI family protein [Balneolaceae bacterium]
MKKMNKFLSLTLAFAFVLTTSVLATGNDKKSDATTWQVDKAHTTVNFSVNHFFTPVDGTFDEFDATIAFDPNNLDGSSIDVTLSVESVNTRNQRRDNHLQSADFFNAEQWPTIRFQSQRIEQRGDGQFVAIGELTIRDVTRTFELPFTLLGVMDHPMQEGMQVAGISAEASLDRTDFGVGVGDWAATAVVGDKVDIRLNLELMASRS